MKNFMLEKDIAYTMSDAVPIGYIGYQATRCENGGFKLSLVLGVDREDRDKIGCELLTLEKNGRDAVTQEVISLGTQDLCKTVKDDEGACCDVKTCYGYSCAVVTELPFVPKTDFFELVVRPYILTENDIRMYGDSAVLTYTGDTDGEGYPILTRLTKRFATVFPTDDTFVFGGIHADSNFGTTQRLQIQNCDETNADPKRACYFKFRFTPEQVGMIERSASVKLCLYPIVQAETDLVVHATDTAWDQMTLTYNNQAQLAKVGDYITQAPSAHRQYVYFDVRPYLIAQTADPDGSLTVSFRVTNDGSKDAKLTYIEASKKDAETSPKIEILTTLYGLEPNLVTSANEGYEPWGYAEHLVDRWFGELVDKVYPKDKDGNLVVYSVKEKAPDGYGLTEPAEDFTRVVQWQSDNYIWVAPNHWDTHPNGVRREDEWEKDRYVRTLGTLGTSKGNAYLSSEYAERKSEYDAYGGIANAGFVGEATGFFHTETLGGRPYIIDPLGNPYFAVGVDDFRMYNKQWALERYGSEEAYYEATTEKLRDMGINTVHVSPQDKVLAVENGLSVVIHLSAVGAYMRSLNRAHVTEGRYPHNNTMNVFDPDFERMTMENIAAEILSKGYHKNPRVLGYTTDNELPGGIDVLTRYLTVDPSEPTNAFSYAVAWTWLARRMSTPVPTLAEYLAHPDNLKMNSEFLAFIYSTYYGIARKAIEAVDPNHMYMGSRVAGNCRFDEAYLRAAGYYLDVITTNLYTGLHFPWEALINYYRYAGKPFLITEFYAKAMDAIDDGEFMMANSTGAGTVVKTQQERGDYYEHQTLLLLESGACVGWTWYCMLDNAQPLYKSAALDREVVMAFVSYGEIPPVARSFVDRDGKVYTAEEVGEIEMLRLGNSMASNHNCNKGVFNRNYTSTVAVYSYDASGRMLGSKSYWVENPVSDELADGTRLTSLDRSRTFELGKKVAADGSYTQTALTTFEGTYVPLARAMRNVSDNLIGLVHFFDRDNI